jgi:hypothetical protein
MRLIFKSLLLLCVFTNDLVAQPMTPYRGTLIDGHSQVRCDINPVEVGQIINSTNIDYVMLSASGCNKREKFFSDPLTQYKNLADVVTGNSKIFGLAGMKNLTNQGVWNHAALKESWKIGEQAKFKGIAEILFQHAVWDGEDARLEYVGLQLRLSGSDLEKIILFHEEKKFPFIIHIEFNDSADKKENTLKDLRILLNQHPSVSFVLIHVGQASPEIARELLANHSNIYFLTSMTSGFNQIFTRGKEVHHQDGWETFFDVSGKNMKQHASRPKWRPEWLSLVSDYPDKFVVGFDNVFAGNWRNRYRVDVAIWRRALAQLDRELAGQLACGNAKRLWGLPVDCQ